MKEFIEIPFGAKNSELCGWEYTIPEGFVASIENGKIIVKKEDDRDEKIRKEILGYFQQFKNEELRGVNISDWIAWLEKQDPKKHEEELENAYKTADEVQYKRGYEDAVKEMEKQGEKKPVDFKAKDWYVSKVDGKIHNMTYNPTDKVEPKFKVGDWVVCDSVYQIKNCIENPSNHKYGYLTNGDYISSNEVNHYHLWTIQDAKDGDVLASNKSIFIFQEEYICEKPTAYCGLMNGLFIEGNGDCWTNEKCYPATQKQRDLLFTKMKEAGYEWDAEKKELRKIEQNPAWSEEDKEFLRRAIKATKDVYPMTAKWLESLKQRLKGE